MHTAFILLASITATSALIGYDCSGPTINTTTFSTTDPLPCDIEDTEPTSDNIAIQLLQLTDLSSTTVSQCKIEIDRTIYYCGMHSHISVVHNGRQQYLQAIPREACQLLHSSGAVYISPRVQLSGIEPNTTATHSVTLAGKIGPDGRCDGTTYSDPYGTWTNVIVQAIVKVTVKSYSAAVRLSDNKIVLRSGQQCRWQSGHCLDSEDGYTFWEPAPTDYCKFNNYDVLYDGQAARVSSKTTIESTMYLVSTEEATFALTQTRQSSLCGFTIIHTEHPKLFILEIGSSGRFKTRKTIPVNNLDIFTYVNSKFIYVEKHLKTQIIQLYKDIIRQKCDIEKQVLKNALALIHVAPEDVATTITREPGHLAIPSGEVVHIIKCIPTTCQTRRTAECYSELPVTYKNDSYFLTPRNHILIKTGTKRECSSILPAMYRIHGTWYRMLPNPVDSVPPLPLQPMTNSKWNYVDPQNLANGGIYSAEDVEKLNDHIMFPVEKIAILNGLAQGASGRTYAEGTVQIHNLLDEQALEKIAENTTRRIWHGFVKFGSVSAGLMGIYVAWRIIKTIINTILNGIALHQVYGWSIRLLVAVWTSLTQFCIFIEARSDRTPRECINEVQLEPLNTQVKPSDVPKNNEVNEQSSDDENTPRPSARFSQRRGKIVFAGGEV